MFALIVLLGCNIEFILNDRIQTAILLSENLTPDYQRIDWFLSGGIKDKSAVGLGTVGLGAIAEADKMETRILTHGKNDNWHFIKDYASTNTAENFKMVERQMQMGCSGGLNYTNIFVVTSEYHFERAKLFADILIPQNEFQWVLAKKEERNSRQMEQLHLKNVMNDIAKLGV
jgi:uncharacterized SAM-binding protein YcdF (DUF218 family)